MASSSCSDLASLHSERHLRVTSIALKHIYYLGVNFIIRYAFLPMVVFKLQGNNIYQFKILALLRMLRISYTSSLILVRALER